MTTKIKQSPISKFGNQQKPTLVWQNLLRIEKGNNNPGEKIKK